MMEGLSISATSMSGSSTRIPPSPSSANRLPSVMKKYMNPGLVRPPNSALATHHAEAQRAALLNLASATNIPSKSSSTSKSQNSPSSKSKTKTSLQHQHSVHGVHGPGHGTSARIPSASSASRQSAATSTTASSSATRKVDLGKYDGGLEADAADREPATGEAAKVLEMDSGSANG